MLLPATQTTCDVQPDILLVEDNYADANLILHFFSQRGFLERIFWLSDGADALDYVFRENEHAAAPKTNLIILDLNLPKIDGREVLDKIRRRSQTFGIPVIVLTTSNRQEDLNSSVALASSAFYTKPSDLTDYETLIQTIVTEEFPKLGITKESRPHP